MPIYACICAMTSHTFTWVHRRICKAALLFLFCVDLLYYTERNNIFGTVKSYAQNSLQAAKRSVVMQWRDR